MLLLTGLFCSVQPGFSATVICEVQEVQEVKGDRVVLVNCDEQRAKDFRPGNKVKVKLKKGK